MAGKNIIRISRYNAPCGELLLGTLNGRLCLCSWLAGRRHSLITRRLQLALRADFAPEADPIFSSSDFASDPILNHAASQLDEYFAGRRTSFDIPLLLAGTPFQENVWRQLCKIPFGQTLSYAALARATGQPTAIRAAANAVASNAISIFVPCHRVVASSGAPGGYAGGPAAKRFLLRLEGLNY